MNKKIARIGTGKLVLVLASFFISLCFLNYAGSDK